jgi:hypothetical protein
MQKSLERHHSLTARLASAMLFIPILLAGLPASRPVEASTDPAAHRAVTTASSNLQRVTVVSKPAGAMIYVDGIQVGRTPMTFPMPAGRYTLFLLAPGHEQYAQRILVQEAPLHIEAKLVPYR